MSDNRIYVACLASYNNGVLHGKWIDATADVEAMQDDINEILRSSKFPNVTIQIPCDECMGTGERPCTSFKCEHCKGTGTLKEIPSAEEWAIHDHEGEALKGIGEHTSLKEIAARIELEELAEREFGSDGPEIVRAYWDNMGSMPDDAQSAVYEAGEQYYGSYDSWTDWAESFLDDTGMLANLPDWARNYFDYEAYGRDARLNGDLFESGGHFFHSR